MLKLKEMCVSVHILCVPQNHRSLLPPRRADWIHIPSLLLISGGLFTLTLP